MFSPYCQDGFLAEALQLFQAAITGSGSGTLRSAMLLMVVYVENRRVGMPPHTSRKRALLGIPSERECCERLLRSCALIFGDKIQCLRRLHPSDSASNRKLFCRSADDNSLRFHNLVTETIRDHERGVRDTKSSVDLLPTPW
jgi:hypothetical protein